MVSIPDLVPVAREDMAIHSDKKEIIGSKSIGPELEVLGGDVGLVESSKKVANLAGVTRESRVSFDRVNNSDTSLATCSNICTVLIEKRNLVMSLVELGGEDDLVPDGQAYIVVKELVWKGWLGAGRVR
ncbi:hypothetical protein HG531_005405 [Fusarium graminearum]|nr:hypothetical protein HG531_005405 [Fusarium graminearum]